MRLSSSQAWSHKQTYRPHLRSQAYIVFKALSWQGHNQYRRCLLLTMWTDAQTDRQTDRPTNNKTAGQMNGQTPQMFCRFSLNVSLHCSLHCSSQPALQQALRTTVGWRLQPCDLRKFTDVYLYQAASQNHAWLTDRLEYAIFFELGIVHCGSRTTAMLCEDRR